MTKLKTSSQAGFSLVEVMIALFIFAVGILGVGAMQLAAIKGNSTARQVSELTNIAADQIERFALLAYDDPDLNDTDGDGRAGLNDVDADADGSATTADGRYQTFWNVAVDDPQTDAKTIRVIVRQPGQARTASIETVKLSQH